MKEFGSAFSDDQKKDLTEMAVSAYSGLSYLCFHCGSPGNRIMIVAMKELDCDSKSQYSRICAIAGSTEDRPLPIINIPLCDRCFGGVADDSEKTAKEIVRSAARALISEDDKRLGIQGTN